jgi:hypothetical protein
VVAEAVLVLVLVLEAEPAVSTLMMLLRKLLIAELKVAVVVVREGEAVVLGPT